MYKASPGLIQGDEDGNDVHFDDDVFFCMCAILYGCVRGNVVKGCLGLPYLELH